MSQVRFSERPKFYFIFPDVLFSISPVYSGNKSYLSIARNTNPSKTSDAFVSVQEEAGSSPFSYLQFVVVNFAPRRCGTILAGKIFVQFVLSIIGLKTLKASRRMVFGQVVIGPPGSGKTTYCNGMSQYLKLIGRKVAIINLDPANDALPYDCAINIEDLIKLSDVMNEHSLGPNGGLVYCMDYLEKNIDWLQSKLEPLVKDHYFLFDFPGQVELFFLHQNAKGVIMKLIKKLNLRLTAINLIDAHLCCDPGKYVSALLLSLSTMLHMELPHINVLSKIDLIESYGKLAFNLDFYTDVQDLSYLQNCLSQDPGAAKYRKLTKELCEVIEDYGLVNFSTLDIQDKESVGNLIHMIDRTNGYIFAGIDASAVEYSKIAVRPLDWDYYRVAVVQEKYMKDEDQKFDD